VKKGNNERNHFMWIWPLTLSITCYWIH